MKVVKQNKAIEGGMLCLVMDKKMPMDNPLLRYHSGHVCFYQPWTGKGPGIDLINERRVVVYNLHQKKNPQILTCGENSTIISAALGGGSGKGIYLIYSDLDNNMRAR